MTPESFFKEKYPEAAPQVIDYLSKHAAMYHSSLLEKAGKQLPTEEEFDAFRKRVLKSDAEPHVIPPMVITFGWVSDQAKLLLASRDAEIERLKKRMDEIILETADVISSTPEVAAAYLKSQGFDPEAEVIKGMEFINKLKEKLALDKTKTDGT